MTLKLELFFTKFKATLYSLCREPAMHSLTNIKQNIFAFPPITPSVFQVAFDILIQYLHKTAAIIKIAIFTRCSCFSHVRNFVFAAGFAVSTAIFAKFNDHTPTTRQNKKPQ